MRGAVEADAWDGQPEEERPSQFPVRAWCEYIPLHGERVFAHVGIGGEIIRALRATLLDQAFLLRLPAS
jgi:hypothetical protein